MLIEVEFYELPDGTEPVRVFLDSLDKKMRAKMFREIDLLAANGPDLREPHSKHLEDRKTMKTPKNQIALAKKYREEYEKSL